MRAACAVLVGKVGRRTLPDIELMPATADRGYKNETV